MQAILFPVIMQKFTFNILELKIWCENACFSGTENIHIFMEEADISKDVEIYHIMVPSILLITY